MALDFGAAIPVRSVADEYTYISTQRCPDCGGQWRVRMQALLQDDQGRHYDRVTVICRQCARCSAFLFDVHSIFTSSQR